jgi:AraC family transcriptional regulator
VRIRAIAKTRATALVPINPPASVLGTENAILTGTNSLYYVPDFAGCLSIKTVVSGSAMWAAAGRQFVVHENSYLILNDRQHYTMTIEAARAVTTFCLFFQRGLVEDVFHNFVTPTSNLLDAPRPAAARPLHFWEKLETHEHLLLTLIRQLRQRLLRGINTQQALAGDFYVIAAELVREHQQTAAAVAKLPAQRAATKLELYRRLLRGRDYLLSTLDQSIQLRDIARAACLSPYHFHRTFSQVFGETPHRYAIRQRLAKARALLTQRDRSVTEVCYECGFESLGSFSSLFRRQYGMSPRACRQASTRK